MSDGYVMRRMERAELDFAVDMAASEGWNPGLRDAEAFWAADPQGYHIGLLGGRPAATISGVRYAGKNGAPAFDFIGLYIVVPGLRGRGYGKRLWDHALETLKAPTVALDSVVAQLDTYRQDGFEVFRHSSRYEGRFGADMETAKGVRLLSDFPFADVLAYDRRCFPAPREAFLRAWISLPGHVCLGLERGGRLAGFGVIRPCGVGSKIGPLFADDDDAALALFRGLCARCPQQPVFYDVPMNNAGAVRLAESHGMKPMFETGRMYRGPVPEIDLGREFGVTTFELG